MSALDRERAQKRELRAKARKSTCRCCGWQLLENIVIAGSERIPTSTPGAPIGHEVRTLYKLDGTFGYSDSICSLRCGFRWAAQRAPKVSPSK